MMAAMPVAPRSTTPTEALAGLVDRVTFHNSENGFCVLRVKARGQRDLITVVGHAAMISAGEFVQASGAWTNDRTHGVQLRASFLNAGTSEMTSKDWATLTLSLLALVVSGFTAYFNLIRQVDDLR